MSELLYNALIINEGSRFMGWVRISPEGFIADIGDGSVPHALLHNPDITARDLKGNWLLPGVIDSHVHFREPGLEHKATIATESRAAAAGGVTSFMEMPNTRPATTTADALADKMSRAANDAVINYAFFAGAANDNLSFLRECDYTHVPGIKLFMGSSTGGMLVNEEKALREIFSLPVLIAVHCEQEEIIRENMLRAKELYPSGNAPLSWHPEIRSALACMTSTQRAVRLARELGTRLHVTHITTAEELSLFRAGDDRITAEACVAHLLFTDEDYSSLGTLIKCNPAIKSRVHRDALRKAVASGIVSTVSTDHAPHSLEEKGAGTLDAPSGMPMVQFSLVSMLHMALEEQLWTPETVVERMCHSQARAFGIDKRGFIRKGYYADMVEVDPNGETCITSHNIVSKCGWSPLEGRTMRSKVITTRVNGHTVYCHAAPEAIGFFKRAMPLTFNR